MGHSKDMSQFYTHLDKEEIKKMLKEQVYQLDILTPEEKNEMRELKKKIDIFEKRDKETEEKLKVLEKEQKQRLKDWNLGIQKQFKNLKPKHL